MVLRASVSAHSNLEGTIQSPLHQDASDLGAWIGLECIVISVNLEGEHDVFSFGVVYGG